MDDLARRYAARDDDTRIGDSIRGVLDRDVRGDLGAVVVVSDGADMTKGARAAALASLGVRVHTVAVGASERLRDDAIARIDADPIAFLRQPARVRVVVRSVGGDTDTVVVTLRIGDQAVREAVAHLDDDGEGTVELPFTASQLGRTVYRVTIPLAPEDAVPENNERAFLVRVTRDKLRVLLVCGRPSWDERYLRAFLKRDPAIDLISFFILRTSSDLTMSSPDELALIPFPTDELFSEHLGSFDIVIFQNFDYGPYQMSGYLPRIRDYVMRGGSFAMIGGDLSFASGGYGETPIAEILPVTMPASSTPETQAVVTDRFAPRIAVDAPRHPIIGLVADAAANTAAWSRLAPLEGANVISGLREKARALLVHPTHRDAQSHPMPVLAVGAAGRGRTLALATDTSYRWGITSAGTSGDASAYERFWDRALRWLARDPLLEPARITTDRERYGPSARIRVTAQLRDERYEAMGGRDVRVVIVDSSGHGVARASVRTDAEGGASAELRGPAEPGGYRAQAIVHGERAPIAEEGFVVEAGGDELADPRARPSLLREIARATGGAFYDDPAHAPELASFDATRTRVLGVAESRPFASPWAFALLVLLFGAEWIVRRAWGHR